MRCAAWCALAVVLLHSVSALPGRRAIGAYPGAGGPYASSSAPFMTLKPFLPAAKPANPFAPAFGPQMFMDKKTELLNNLFSKPAPSRRALAPPGGPPAAPTTVDPGVYNAKKVEFLNTLFGGLGPAVAGPDPGPAGPIVPPGFWLPPTTAAPVDDTLARAKMLAQLVTATLQEPIVPPEPATPPMLFAPPPVPTTPKPTIVPPGFWLPASPLVAPGEYASKVSEFLEKLFASKMTTPAPLAVRSLAARHHEHNPHTDPEREERSLPPPPLNPKDMVINSILTEVSELKAALMDTVTDMVAKQKSLPYMPPKKPKILPPWVPTPPPTPDPLEPYQKRLETLGQVFDMLTGLGQEVTAPKNDTATTTTRAVRSVPARSVQLAVHQGYQSMPPGTEELVSVGAGRDPKSNHEGGGLNLKIKVPQ
ncbi:uncharacterized protein LOC132198798 [Neocloeon triangulifer]|uniref:uncharacterized protein LOC132198798 n=1 Tax=Neocloeon triangulifer TaxID=2078957 RepID=UPI00286F7FAB|nr:uncharacterized protein LOC132198798 [Neocloeon triangulifer]